MKKIQLFFTALLFTSILSAQQVIDPNAEVRQAKDFHGINLSSAFDVYLTQGNTEAVAVSASEEKHRDRIKVEVKAGILYISYDSKGLSWSSGNKKLKAYISFKNIDFRQNLIRKAILGSSVSTPKNSIKKATTIPLFEWDAKKNKTNENNMEYR